MCLRSIRCSLICMRLMRRYSRLLLLLLLLLKEATSGGQWNSSRAFVTAAAAEGILLMLLLPLLLLLLLLLFVSPIICGFPRAVSLLLRGVSSSVSASLGRYSRASSWLWGPSAAAAAAVAVSAAAAAAVILLVRVAWDSGGSLPSSSSESKALLRGDSES